MPEAPDQAERDRAIAAREDTVLIDAGAGAGKTTLLVNRMLALVAPANDADRAIPLSRMAAVTFTRRAAGELRLRVRERLLAELARTDLSKTRTGRLLDALGSVDGALLGTIHGFADRLLRLQPMAAKLSPAYRVEEDIDFLVDETFSLLLHAVQSGTLAAELEGEDPEYVAQVERTFQEALRAGLLVNSYERDPLPPKVGLDLLVRGFVEHRDRELSWTGTGAFDRAAFEQAARAFLDAMKPVTGSMIGTQWLMRLARRITALLEDSDDIALYELVGRIKAGRKRFKKTKHFEKGSAARDVWDAFSAEGGFGDQMRDPLVASMARRLALTRHAVVRLYERVKIRHQALDPIDLLVTLRDLLRDDLEVRRFYQGLFDHVLVDELQDTDPLQAEIILYLSEAEPAARRWQDVVVGNGRLTLVGDPKQSIYRFRRADVGMYEQIREQIAKGAHVPIRLSANFRSTPTLIEWANDRFSTILGTDPTRTFDATTGQVFHQKQVSAVEAPSAPAIHALPYASADGTALKAGPARKLEGKALAAYLRWLVNHSGIKVRDQDDEELRPVAWSDIAVLALVTTNLRHLFSALDREAVPYAISGGVLFTTDPLHRQFLLGLRAIADRNDGVAEAALLRPPYFAIDLRDLVHEKAGIDDEHAARARAARDWVREARRRRFERSPGQTARALLEETGIGRAVALGPNGEQRLRHLRELCLQLELHAATDGLDYDSVTGRLRDWIEHPPKLDPPRPLGAEAVQVLTVHQAKGLEFPVVVLWDGVGLWRAYEAMPPWRVDRSGAAWAIKTNDVEWEEPPGSGILEREKQYANSEKRRLVYVAATRARDLLVVPKPAWQQPVEDYVHAELLAGSSTGCILSLEGFVDGQGAGWALAANDVTEIRDVDDRESQAAWNEALSSASNPQAAPSSVTSIAKAQPVLQRLGDADVEVRPPRPARVGRFGPIFGEVVHLALGSVLTRGLAPSDAVVRAARALRLAEHLDEAVRDVERGLDTLHGAGLTGDGSTLRVEYPVAVEQDGKLVSGYIDLVTANAGELTVIDFKTDQWADAATAAEDVFPQYAAQVRAYAAFVGARRCGLLFTSNGQLAWIQ